ncbi:hypothetical protein [Endozoicomonas sp. 8E]|uniref:hypothetical protein n=1 Tax=Endozoicomonas sp. 8E TaxID=3035692 RepID=UPI0029393F9F|nr:hypothetical protein [Endozoicomonas sp. 8E]WOG29421.1 hypothetical protein P6910_07170 [Endozoicomonas sp. 8E]
MGTSCWSFATPSLCVGLHTSPEKRTLQLEIGMGSHAGAWEPEFCDSLLRGNDDLRAWERGDRV